MGQRIYFDTNQIYYFKKIVDECEGYEFGDYSWAYERFPGKPDMIADIKALCYIFALQDQWDLEFSPSHASYTELCTSEGRRAAKTREAWEIAAQGNPVGEPVRLATGQRSRKRQQPELIHIEDEMAFISDVSDRNIIRDFLKDGADVLLTSDGDILRHKEELRGLGVSAMRPHEWINEFLKDARGQEDGVDWVERILFTIG